MAKVRMGWGEAILVGGALVLLTVFIFAVLFEVTT